MSTLSCGGCGNTSNLRRCNGCKKVYYCCTECQLKDWKSGHKKKCKLLTKSKYKNHDNLSASNDVMMDLRDSIKDLNPKNEKFNTNKIEEFWMKNCEQIAKNIIKKYKFANKNDGETYLNDLCQLLSKLSFSYLKRSRTIIGSQKREIWKLEFWCSINLRSIQTNYNQCPHLHLYFKDRDYNISVTPKIYINIKSSDIYNVLINQFGLFEDIIFLIVEYLPYNEDNYCLLTAKKNNKLRFYDEESGNDVKLDKYIGVSDNTMIQLLLNSIKTIFGFDQSRS